MKKKISILTVLASAAAAAAAPYLPQNGETYETNAQGYVTKYGGAASSADTVAISKDSASFVGWATGYLTPQYGSNVDDSWKTPENALGKVTGDVYNIVCLGDGGSITLTFANGIANGDGADFAVFENSFNEGFLELGYVEVSSDGVHFVRFPNFYLGETKLGPFDNTNYPYMFYNLASKYDKDYGHGFDLAELEYAYNYALATDISESSFSAEYTAHITENFQYLDLNNIGFVKIVDIIGDGNHGFVDSSGYDIYDPSNCVGSAGFDLQGVGVIHPSVPEPAEWAAILGALALFFAAKRRK